MLPAARPAALRSLTSACVQVQSAAFPVGTARGHALGAGLQQRLVSAADLCPAPGNDAAAQASAEGDVTLTHAT